MEHWVSFPGLGIDRLSVSPTLVQFTLFGKEVDIRFYGALIALGFLLAIVYAYRRAPKIGVDREAMIDVVLVSAVVAVLCARLYYVIFSDAAYYFSHPTKIFAIWDGGLAIYGGIIGAFVTGFVMCRVRKVSIPAMFDLAGIGFLIGQGIGRWGNFFNQEAYGANTTLPWGMTGDMIQKGLHGDVADPSLPVHPTFLYESLWCLLGVLIMHLMFVKCYRFKGQIFGSYLIWYGTGRLFIESLRSDSLYIPNTAIRVSQVVAVATIAVGVAALIVCAKHQKKQAVQGDGETVTIAQNEEE